MTVTLQNTMQSVDEQHVYFVAGEAIDVGNLVGISEIDGKAYLLSNSKLDGYAVAGYSGDGYVVAGDLVKVLVNSIVEFKIASGVTLYNAMTVYANDSGELTLTNTDHKVGRVVSTKNSGKAFAKIQWM